MPVPMCPTNGQPGKPVDALILKACLAVSLTKLGPTSYRFCHEPDCPTVYYAVDGSQVFDEAVLRERVYQKHPDDDDVLVCYCFRHTVGSIRAELLATGTSAVVDAVTTGIQAGQCACDIRNPQGTCCLGNVVALVARLRAELSSG